MVFENIKMTYEAQEYPLRSISSNSKSPKKRKTEGRSQPLRCREIGGRVNRSSAARRRLAAQGPLVGSASPVHPLLLAAITAIAAPNAWGSCTACLRESVISRSESQFGPNPLPGPKPQSASQPGTSLFGQSNTCISPPPTSSNRPSFARDTPQSVFTQCIASVAVVRWHPPLPPPRCASQLCCYPTPLIAANHIARPPNPPGVALDQTSELRSTTKASPEHPRVSFCRPPAPGETATEPPHAGEEHCRGTPPSLTHGPLLPQYYSMASISPRAPTPSRPPRLRKWPRKLAPTTW
jgi:hypothetical protein